MKKATEIERVALALYNLNKIAKKERDHAATIRQNIYGEEGAAEEQGHDDYDDYDNEPRERVGTSGQHRAMHAAQEKSENSYSIKNKFLLLAISRYTVPILGYHEFADADRDYVQFGGYSFHLASRQSDISLGTIYERITAEKIGKKLSWKSAMGILLDVFAAEIAAEKKAKDNKITAQTEAAAHRQEEYRRVREEQKIKYKQILAKYPEYTEKIDWIDNLGLYLGDYSAELFAFGYNFAPEKLENFLKNSIEAKKKAIETKNEIKQKNEKLLEKIRAEKKTVYISRVLRRIAYFGGRLDTDWQFATIEKALLLPKQTVIDILSAVPTRHGQQDAIHKNIMAA